MVLLPILILGDDSGVVGRRKKVAGRTGVMQSVEWDGGLIRLFSGNTVAARCAGRY